MSNHWLIKPAVPEELTKQFPEINPIILQLLANRELTTQEQIDEFLNPDYGRDVHDPFLFRDMKKAVLRVFEAIENGERIVVHGDYDADGVSASVILRDTLVALGAKNLHVHLPHREREGYGMRSDNIEEYAKTEVKLVITCDCGTSNVKEVALAQEKGIDVIITDHHEEPPELPKPFAFLNPKLSEETYPYPYLAGGGVAFKLVQALSVASREPELVGGKALRNVQPLPEGFEKWLLDLVAISAVTDIMPLVGENRTLVRFGLVVLRKSRRVGLQKLIEVARIKPEKIDAFSIGFQIGPRINAAGRIDHANAAFALLTCEDEVEAEKLAKDLDAKNVERQRLTEEIVKQAKEQIGDPGPQRVLVAIADNWPVGILGLVAGKIADGFNRPTFIGTRRGETINASGRSIESFDITAALRQTADLFTQFGGHAGACGLVMPASNEAAFREAIRSITAATLKEEDLSPQVEVDAEVPFTALTWELAEALEQFEPFGEANTTPRFLVRGLLVTGTDRLGKNDRHLRLVVTDGENTLARKIICFGFGESHGDRLKVGDRIDAVVEVSVNEWNGNRELQLKLSDMEESR